ncbi:MAG: ATP-binding cassette domain-containing protein, partial [Mycoplasmataceae bacterium]|nr:ATP-binding cassette domain-containing protein [Mycoplasmataceae bacterium]
MNNWLVNVKNVRKNYKKKNIFKGLSFQISENYNMALIGVNGSGKSTLLHMIANLIGYDGGHISYSSLIKNKQWYNIDIVTQLSVYTRYDRVIDHIKLVCGLGSIDFTTLKSTSIYKFFKIDRFIGKKFIELSGGQKKIVEIFCALCHKPKLVIFDELLNELDLSKQRPYLEYIR